jgi:uncharacterized OsmC-like protein
VRAGDPFHGEVEIGRGYRVKMRFGLDRHVGGLHDLPNRGDLLCAAVAACEDGTLRMIAALLGVTVEELEVEVSGMHDVRGALAVSDDVRVGFELLRCRIRLRAAAGTDPRLLGRPVAAGEPFCVNLDTLRNGVHVDIASDV